METLEKADDPQEKHLHCFKVIFGEGKKHHNVTCRKCCTVLEALQQHLGDKLAKIKCTDDKIIIQLGKDDKKYIIATHFPCCLVDDGEILTIFNKSERVEEIPEQHVGSLQPKDSYSVFYIDTTGGVNTKTKRIFRSNAVTRFKFLCVYGEKGITVKQALERDGRFSDLGGLELSENTDKNSTFEWEVLVDDVNQRELKICLLPGQGGKKTGGNRGRKPEEVKQEHVVVMINSQITQIGRNILDDARNRMKRLEKHEPGNSAEIQKIYEFLRQQFPELQKWMQSRFPGDSYQKALELKRKNFGKIQQSFSEVHRLEKLLKMGKSVCKVEVYKVDAENGNPVSFSGVCQGTGFVLCDSLMLTSAHLFKGCVEGKELLYNINVYALFNFDEPKPMMDYFCFLAEKTFIGIDEKLDYAVLELKPEDQKCNPRRVPPGLLNRFGPLPVDGEACIIGHPAGSVKKIDPTCIIEPEKREYAVRDHLDKMFIVQSVHEKFIDESVQTLKKQGIADIMIGGEKADQVATYYTFMYEGASGSPVFDAHGQLFGLHTGGYVLPDIKDNVIEYAHPLLAIFEKFVCNLKKHENDEVLKMIKKAAEGNKKLEDILKVKPMEEDL